MRSAVDLPEPDGPTSTMNSPSSMWQIEAGERGMSLPGRSGSHDRTGRPPSPRPAGLDGCAHHSTPSESPRPIRAAPRRSSSRRARARAPLPAPSTSSPKSAAPTTGRRRRAVDDDLLPEADGGPRSIAPSSRPSPALHEPAPEQHLDRLSSEVEPVDRDAGERDDLGREPLHELGRDRIVRRFGEHDRRELDEPPVGDPVSVDRLGELERRRHLEVRRHRALEAVAGPRPSSLTRRRPERRDTDVVATAPVARDGPERREAHLAAVRRHTDAVDASAAVTATPQPRAVPARRTANVSLPTMVRGPVTRLDCVLELALLGREVDARRGRSGRCRRRACRSGRVRRSRPRLSSIPWSSSPSPRARCDAASRAARGRCARSAPSERTSARSVLELPPSTARTTGVLTRGPRRGRGAARQPATARPARRRAGLPDQRMREQRFPSRHGVARDGRLGGEPLVRGDVLGRAREAPAGAETAAAARGRVDSMRAGSSTTSSAASPESHRRFGRRRPARRRYRRRATRRARSRPRCRRRRRAARAVPASRRAPGRGTARAAPLDLRDRRGARRAVSLLLEDLVVAVEVVEVRRGDDAQLLDAGCAGARRDPRPRRRARREAPRQDVSAVHDTRAESRSGG